MSVVWIKIKDNAFDSGNPLADFVNYKNHVRIALNTHSPSPCYLGPKSLTGFSSTSDQLSGMEQGCYDLIIDRNGVEVDGMRFEEYLTNETSRMSLITSLTDFMQRNVISVYKDGVAQTPADIKTFTA